MLKSTLISLVEQQIFTAEESLDEIDALTEKHPWCATFHVLKAIGARQYDRLNAKEQLNLASVYINDRAKLYRYTVRKDLLKRIAQAEAALEPEGELIEPQVGQVSESDLDTVKVQETSGTSASTGRDVAVSVETEANRDQPGIAEDAVKSENQLISSDPLEAQILQAAILHLGEMEMDSALSPKQTLGIENTPPSHAEPSVDEEDNDLSDFARWLRSKNRPAAATQDGSRPIAEQAVIDRFIQESPQIRPAKASFFSPSQMGKMSLVEDESFVTETLAKIYERQGDFKKAAKAYQQLGLKYPEKSVYFAALQKKAETQT